MADKIVIPKRLRDIFLARLAIDGNVSAAAALIKRSRMSMYRYRKTHPHFAERWDSELEEFMDSVEAEANRRATQGVQEPVYYKGEVVGHVTRYSDRLIEFLLDRRRYPQKQKLEHTGKDGGPLQMIAAEPHDDTL